MKNYGYRGGCYPPRDPMIVLLLIHNNSQFKKKAHAFCLHLPVSRQVHNIKECLILQIFSKQQVSSVDLYSCCSCYVFRHNFDFYFFEKRVNCFAILSCPTKITQPRYAIFFIYRPFFSHLCYTIDVIYQMSHTSSKFG